MSLLPSAGGDRLSMCLQHVVVNPLTPSPSVLRQKVISENNAKGNGEGSAVGVPAG